MNVLISLSQSFPVMIMHSVTTQWAAMNVSATVATLEMILSAVVRYCHDHSSNYRYTLMPYRYR